MGGVSVVLYYIVLCGVRGVSELESEGVVLYPSGDFRERGVTSFAIGGFFIGYPMVSGCRRVDVGLVFVEIFQVGGNFEGRIQSRQIKELVEPKVRETLQLQQRRWQDGELRVVVD